MSSDIKAILYLYINMCLLLPYCQNTQPSISKQGMQRIHYLHFPFAVLCVFDS